jgi:hypothetical protein
VEREFLFLCERVSMFKKVVFAAAPLAVLGSLAATGTAHAAATLTYSDTSVSVASNTTPVVDEFTGITAASTTGLTPGASLTLTAAGNALGTLKWTNATAVSGTDTATLPVPAAGAATVTVTVTDGKATAAVAVAATAATTGVDLTLTPDIVTLPVAATDNTTGTVSFGTVAAGVAETLGNAPVGVALSGGSLSATTAVPGVYQNVTVTATGGGGAAAVETLAIDVKGSVVQPARPHLYGGHVITVNNNDAEIGWHYGPGVTCALTRTFGYGFTVNGSPHQGFTCYNSSKDAPGTDVGYWSGLAAGHGYDIQLIPAGTNRQPLPNAQVGWIYIHTTS